MQIKKSIFHFYLKNKHFSKNNWISTKIFFEYLFSIETQRMFSIFQDSFYTKKQKTNDKNKFS